MKSLSERLTDIWDQLSEAEKKKADALICAGRVWSPLPGPQTQAYESEADITGYGGAAGGGKSDFIAGLALTKHKRILIMRREKAQTEGIVQRITEILGSTAGYSGQKSVWRTQGALIEFGGLDNLGDERRWQGRQHDLKALDEVTEMREAQARFVIGWNRSSSLGVKPRVVMTFNPPTTSDGQWVIRYFAPWLDKNHPNPAKPGELRWFTTIEDEDVELPDGKEFVLKEGERIYDFDRSAYKATEIIKPKSRTFIPAKVTDNPYYMRTGYISTLQSLPEPLRSQMLDGDFAAGLEDDMWQIVPSSWVDIAMKRWKPKDIKPPMDSIGVDVARGGKDETVIARRHGSWFDELLSYPGEMTPDGAVTAGLVVTNRKDQAPVHIDIVGWGSDAYGQLDANGVHVIGINGAEASIGKTECGNLRFFFFRAEILWRVREWLNPESNAGATLPNCSKLKADLCAVKWKPTARGIQAESKEEVAKRIGRSTDRFDAVAYALIETVKKKDYDAIINMHKQKRNRFERFSRK